MTQNEEALEQDEVLKWIVVVSQFVVSEGQRIPVLHWSVIGGLSQGRDWQRVIRADSLHVVEADEDGLILAFSEVERVSLDQDMVEVDVYVIVLSIPGDFVAFHHVLVIGVIYGLAVPVNDNVTALVDTHGDTVLVFEGSVLTLDNRVVWHLLQCLPSC